MTLIDFIAMYVVVGVTSGAICELVMDERGNTHHVRLSVCMAMVIAWPFVAVIWIFKLALEGIKILLS